MNNTEALHKKEMRTDLLLDLLQSGEKLPAHPSEVMDDVSGVAVGELRHGDINELDLIILQHTDALLDPALWWDGLLILDHEVLLHVADPTHEDLWLLHGR